MLTLTQSQYDSLSATEKAAITKRIPEPSVGTKQTGLEFLNSIGAGAAAIAAYVEQDKADNRANMSGVADLILEAGVSASLISGLFAAGVPTTEIIGVAGGYVQADGAKRLQVRELLAI